MLEIKLGNGKAKVTLKSFEDAQEATNFVYEQLLKYPAYDIFIYNTETKAEITAEDLLCSLTENE